MTRPAAAHDDAIGFRQAHLEEGALLRRVREGALAVDVLPLRDRTTDQRCVQMIWSRYQHGVDVGATEKVLSVRHQGDVVTEDFPRACATPGVGVGDGHDGDAAQLCGLRSQSTAAGPEAREADAHRRHGALGKGESRQRQGGELRPRRPRRGTPGDPTLEKRALQADSTTLRSSRLHCSVRFVS